MYDSDSSNSIHVFKLNNKMKNVKSNLVKTLFNKKTLNSKLTGKPVIHFAHANGMPSRVYAPIFDKLSEHYTVVFIPIMGQSQPLNVEWDSVSNSTFNMPANNTVDAATDDASNEPKNKQNPYPIDNHWRSLTQQVLDSVELTCKRHQVDAVISLGHSLGALCTLQAIYRKPKLFHQAVLMDPPLIYGYSNFIWHIAKLTSETLVNKLTPAGISKNRRDVWESREQARKSLSKKGFFKVFEPRCFDNYINYGLKTIELDDQPSSKSKLSSEFINPSKNMKSKSIASDTFNHNHKDNLKDKNNRYDNKPVTLTIPKQDEVQVFKTNPSWYWLTPNHAPKIPVTLIIGQQSPFYQRGFVQKIHKRLSIPYQLHKGGHMFPLEHPDSVAQDIIKLLNYTK